MTITKNHRLAVYVRTEGLTPLEVWSVVSDAFEMLELESVLASVDVRTEDDLLFIELRDKLSEQLRREIVEDVRKAIEAERSDVRV